LYSVIFIKERLEGCYAMHALQCFFG